MPTETVVERIRRKLQVEIARQRLSQRDLAGLLAWSQARVARVLNGRQELLVEDVGAFCFVLNLRFTELVRDDGYEFVADLAPTELRVLEAYRQLAKPTQDAVRHLLDANLQRQQKVLFGKPRPRR